MIAGICSFLGCYIVCPTVYDGFHRLAESSINFLHSSRLPDSSHSMAQRGNHKRFSCMKEASELSF